KSGKKIYRSYGMAHPLANTEADQVQADPRIYQISSRGWLPSWQFVRYLLVGVWNTVFGYLVYVTLTWVFSRHVAYGYLYAAVLSNIIAITVAFFGYKWFVFKTRGNYLREWLRCFMVYGAAALPNLLLLPVVVNVLIYAFHIPPVGRLN